MDTRIYVMTHKEIPEISDQMYIPLQVGTACQDALGYTGDNTGENISEKNPFYCELTGIYWLWKNVQCDIIGICHYRRYFVREDMLLDQGYIEKVLKKYPIIIPDSGCVKESNVYDHYAKKHHIEDLELCRDVIREKYPQYLDAFDFAMQTVLFSIGNMWITSKDIFDRYCSWLFDILFEVEKRIGIEGYDDYQKRVMGFLSERLFRVWLFMQSEKIAEEAVKQVDMSEVKRANLLYQCIKLKLEPLFGLYRAGMIRESLVQPFCCTDDFDGKIPVWVFWWQGEADMPELVRGCIRSLKQNLPSDKTVFRLVTLENCMRYVTLTEAIIHKFNEGKISCTQLSHILWAELLFRYGGLWIDAAVYVVKPIGAEILEQQVFAWKVKPPVWKDKILKERWAGELWYSGKQKRLFQLLTEGLWYYWENENDAADDGLVDYIIAAIAEEFQEVSDELEQCGCSQETVLELSQWLNRKYLPERVKRLLERSTFYKVNPWGDYQKENMAGEKTIYGYLYEKGETAL